MISFTASKTPALLIPIDWEHELKEPLFVIGEGVLNVSKVYIPAGGMIAVAVALTKLTATVLAALTLAPATDNPAGSTGVLTFAAPFATVPVTVKGISAPLFAVIAYVGASYN